MDEIMEHVKNPLLTVHHHMIELDAEITPCHDQLILRELKKVNDVANVRPAVLPYANANATSGPGLFNGYNIRETGGANPIAINIYDGVDNTGRLLATSYLLALASPPPITFTKPLTYDHGLYVEYIGTGIIKGLLHIIQD